MLCKRELRSRQAAVGLSGSIPGSRGLTYVCPVNGTGGVDMNQHVLVTGSAGHLGEALMLTFRAARRPAVGLDIRASLFTDRVGSICDRAFVRECLRGAH